MINTKLKLNERITVKLNTRHIIAILYRLSKQFQVKVCSISQFHLAKSTFNIYLWNPPSPTGIVRMEGSTQGTERYNWGFVVHKRLRINFTVEYLYLPESCHFAIFGFNDILRSYHYCGINSQIVIYSKSDVPVGQLIMASSVSYAVFMNYVTMDYIEELVLLPALNKWDYLTSISQVFVERFFFSDYL